MKDNVIIFGASGHGKVIVDIIEKEDKYKIIGFIDDDISKIGNIFFSYKILGTSKDIKSICKEFNVHQGIISIGDNFIRYTLSQYILSKKSNFKFISTIHPSAQIARDVRIGEGSAIMAGVVINSSAKIGEHTIINTNSTVEHDCIIGDFVSLAPSVSIGGNVEIKKFSIVAISSTIIHNITIGENVLVGANSLILKNVKDNSLIYGTPTKFIRYRKFGEKYL